MKEFNSSKFCVFVIFKDALELTSVQKTYGKKSFVPILLNPEDEKIGEDLTKLLKSFPQMDYIINLSGALVSKHFEKLKPIR